MNYIMNYIMNYYMNYIMNYYMNYIMNYYMNYIMNYCFTIAELLYIYICSLVAVQFKCILESCKW